jgi:hypothetical protein
MTTINVIGVDPGLVDTGAVRLSFHPSIRRVSVSVSVFKDMETDTAPLVDWVRQTKREQCSVFIEEYVPRPGMRTTGRMQELERKLRSDLPNARLLRNMGVKQVITQEMMELLDVWSFKKTTHHQDLRSAARIALFGMAKDEPLNLLLATIITEYVDGRPWLIDHL